MIIDDMGIGHRVI